MSSSFRSADLSPSPAAADQAGNAYLIVRAGEELFALDGATVREVTRWRALTPVPGSPALLPGVISQRGLVLPVVDLRLLMGLAATPPDRATRLVLCQHGSVDLALLVDAVVDLADIAAADLAPPPAGLEPGRAGMLAAVTRHADRPLAVIDLAALIVAVQEAM